jgi:bacterioferritin-associated ferredoxin
MLSEEEILARLKPGCICKGIKLYKIQDAINNGATSYEEIAKTTGIGGGSCNSKRCGTKVRELLEKQNLNN